MGISPCTIESLIPEGSVKVFELHKVPKILARVVRLFDLVT